MEKVYNAMKSVGIWNLVLGILSVIAGCLAGALLIVNGVRLLHKKKELLF